jgi:cation:H+ antiporter
MSSTIFDAGLVAVGLLFLFFGADWLVDGASKLAISLGIRPLVVGATVVALGTSSPEILVGVVASFKGSSSLVLGNILGSNLANIGLILGLSALILPLRINLSVFRIELPVMLGTVVIFYLLAFNGVLGRLEGIALLSGLSAFSWYYLHQAQKEHRLEVLVDSTKSEKAFFKIHSAPFKKSTAIDPPPQKKTLWSSIGFVVFGSLVLVAGAEALVRGAVGVARAAGISKALIGLSLVALGTSLPELATSLVAALRKKTDLCVGNVLGSNIMNVLAVGGAAACISPVAVSNHQLAYDFPAVVIISALLLPLMKTGNLLSRGEGMLLLAAYGAYMYFSFGGTFGPFGF